MGQTINKMISGAPKAKLPIVYSSSYNIGFMGLENLHPFDSKKYQKIHAGLIKHGILEASQFHEPEMISDDDLMEVHPAEYLLSLMSSTTVAHMIEVPVGILPNWIIQRRVLNPMRYATSGSLLAANLAVEHGWGINLGGGYHHASATNGGGFCIFADISLIILKIREVHKNIKRFMIVDLDAHQGNGHGNDKASGVYDPSPVFIYDAYNIQIFPNDAQAKQGIDFTQALRSGENDRNFLDELQNSLPECVDKFQPDLIIYNAGTDLLEGDPLGRMNITPEGILRRDEIVFQEAFDRKIPIVMLLSGGYQQNNAGVITDSLINLDSKFHLFQDSSDNIQLGDSSQNTKKLQQEQKEEKDSKI